VLIAGGLLNALIGILVDKTGLTGTDRLLGMLFGAARGVLIVGVVVMVFRVLELDQEEWWDESGVVGLAEPVADWLQDFLHAGLEHIDEIIPPSDVAPNEAAAAQSG
jgi:membrane protein required for colicin V production